VSLITFALLLLAAQLGLTVSIVWTNKKLFETEVPAPRRPVRGVISACAWLYNLFDSIPLLHRVGIGNQLDLLKAMLLVAVPPLLFCFLNHHLTLRDFLLAGHLLAALSNIVLIGNGVLTVFNRLMCRRRSS
jgi:hypothetical protein